MLYHLLLPPEVTDHIGDASAGSVTTAAKADVLPMSNIEMRQLQAVTCRSLITTINGSTGSKPALLLAGISHDALSPKPKLTADPVPHRDAGAAHCHPAALAADEAARLWVRAERPVAVAASSLPA